MAYGRISVPLTTDERGALIKIAELECRDPREQLRYMLRTEAQQRGLIADNELGAKTKAAYTSGSTRETARTQTSAPES